MPVRRQRREPLTALRPSRSPQRTWHSATRHTDGTCRSSRTLTTTTRHIDGAIARCRAETSRPSLVIFKTTIGYGSPTTSRAPRRLTAHRLASMKSRSPRRNLGWDPDKHFHIPPRGAYARLRSATERGKRAREDWQRRFAAYEKAFPQLAQEFRDTLAGKLPDGWDSALPVFQPGESQPTRNASGKGPQRHRQTRPLARRWRRERHRIVHQELHPRRRLVRCHE
jgi:transketolase